ncbi:MAG TPA: hypothetical protein VFZ67_09090 [Nitrososphaera sp.]
MDLSHHDCPAKKQQRQQQQQRSNEQQPTIMGSASTAQVRMELVYYYHAECRNSKLTSSW